jgi:hypothetical protein
VDLVAMTAAHAIRENLGLGESLLDLRRDDVFVIEGDDLKEPGAWAGPCTERAHWFNPNKHRHALFEASPGAIDAVRGGGSFPRPWLGSLVATDRHDLTVGEGCGLADWLALPGRNGGFAVVLASWDREQALANLPSGRWPDTHARLLRLQMWSLALVAESAEAAREDAEAVAVTRSRAQGLLIHPHVEGWTMLEPPWPLDEETSS